MFSRNHFLSTDLSVFANWFVNHVDIPSGKKFGLCCTGNAEWCGNKFAVLVNEPVSVDVPVITLATKFLAALPPFSNILPKTPALSATIVTNWVAAGTASHTSARPFLWILSISNPVSFLAFCHSVILWGWWSI